ncbi:MAG: TlpA family protein disulfide reductase [Betaproteobacteria bacterium]|nr:TlpA family protein disulfide reductase [Betaproteobacteria bacterium]
MSSADAQEGRRRFCLQAALALLLGACDEAKPRITGPAPGDGFRAPAVAGLDGKVYGWPQGRPLLVNFWATWCRPCRAEMPALDRLYRESRARGLEVLAVSVDADLQLVREFILQTGVTFPILFDREGAATRQTLAIAAFPTTLLVARDGVVSEIVVGAREWDRGPARAAVDALL